MPCTTRLTGENLLRVVLPRGIAGNREECEVMVKSILAEVVEKLRTLGDLQTPATRWRAGFMVRTCT